MKKKWQETEINRLRELYPIAQSKGELVAAFPRCSLNSIGSKASRLGLHSGLQDKAIQLYNEEKLSVYKVAEILGCSRGNLDRTIRKAGYMRSLAEAMQVRKDKKLPVVPASEKGKRAFHWKGGRWEDKNRYIWLYMPEHPRAKGKYVQEHIVVWEQAHGRPLPVGWVIHHLNGVRNDNRPINLHGMSNTRHNRLIPTYQGKIRQLEAENAQLRRAFEDNQMIFYVSEN